MQYKNCRKQFSFFTRISVYINLTCLLQVTSIQVFTPKKVFTKCICNFFFVSFSQNKFKIENETLLQHTRHYFWDDL